MKKNNKLHLPISTEHKNRLKERADKCGLTLTAYCLFILLNAKPKVETLEPE